MNAINEQKAVEDLCDMCPKVASLPIRTGMFASRHAGGRVSFLMSHCSAPALRYNCCGPSCGSNQAVVSRPDDYGSFRIRFGYTFSSTLLNCVLILMGFVFIFGHLHIYPTCIPSSNRDMGLRRWCCTENMAHKVHSTCGKMLRVSIPEGHSGR